MTDDFLDDDDLLALQADLDSEFGDLTDDIASSSSSAGKGQDPESVRAVIRLICEQASSVVTTVLSKNVDYKIASLQTPNGSNVKEFVNTQALLVCVEFERDLQGKLYMALTKKDTAALSDLMMMGDGTAEFEDDHKDALMELANQIMGSVSTTLAGEYGVSFTIGQATVDEYSPEDLPFAMPDAVLAEIDMRIEEISDTKVIFYTDSQLSHSIATVTGKPDSSNSDMNFDDLGAEMERTMGSIMGASESAPAYSAPDSGRGKGFQSTGNKALDMLMDVDLDITIELGRTYMSLRRILEMGPGSIVEMERFAGEPVDLLVNDKVIAKGEVVVVDENFGIRIVSLVTPEERVKSLR
jgi:flagellar motor switch protein FliN